VLWGFWRFFDGKMFLLTVLQTHARNKMPTDIASKFPGGKNIVGAHSFQ
jgi:hypothetical protein